MHDGQNDRNEHASPFGAATIRLAPGVAVARQSLRISAVRSSGPGGQNVNKVATKVEMRIALSDVPIDPEAMHRLVRIAGRRITSSGEIVLASQEHRSQSRNRDECLAMLRSIVRRAMTPPKRRVATRPTRSSVARREESKRRRSDLKSARRRPGADE